MTPSRQMMSFAHSVRQYIKLFVEKLSESDLDKKEILRISAEYGDEVWLFLLCELLTGVNWASTNSDEESKLKIKLFEQTVESLFEDRRTSFQYIVGKAFEESGLFGEVETIVQRLNLSLKVRIHALVGLAQSQLLGSAERTRDFLVDWLQTLLTELKNPSRQDVPPEVFHALLHFLGSREDFMEQAARISMIRELSSLLRREDLDWNALPLHPNLHEEIDRFPDVTDVDFCHGFGKNSIEVQSRILGRLDNHRSVAQVLKECGYIATYSDEFFNRLLSVFAPFPDNEVAIAEIIGVFVGTHTGLETLDQIPFFLNQLEADTHLPTPSQWNVEVFTRVVTKLLPTLNWSKVWLHLDHTGFLVPDQLGFNILRQVRESVGNFPKINDLVFREWKNTKGQLSLIVHSLHWVDAYKISPNQMEELKIESTEPCVWYSLDLLNTLLRLSQTNMYNDVRQMLNSPLKVHPEVLLCGLALVDFESRLKDEFMETLFPQFVFHSHPNSNPVIKRLWSKKPQEFVKWCALLRVKEEKWCERIIDICASVLPENALGTFLDVSLSTKTESGYEFAIQLAATASKKDMISMESWTSNELRVQDHLFVRSLISFVESNRSSSSTGEAKRSTLVLLISIMDILFRDVDLLNTVNRQALEEVHKRYQSDFPNDSRLRNLVDESTHLSVRAANYDKVTTGILENVFSKKCSVKAVIQQVKTWQDQDLLGVLIYNLIDEWRFFETYPADQLEVAAELYGTFIMEGIFKEHSLVVALVIILKSFDGSEKLINFGVKALRISRDTLISYPDYCRQLLRTHGLQQRTPDLLDFLEQKVTASAATAAPTEQPSQLKDVIKPVTLGAETSHSTSSNRKTSGFGVQFNLDTLLEKQKNSVIPSDDVRDEIHLLINNLVSDNVEEKVKDLKEKIEPKYYPYFAQYLVTQRVSIELNQQETYRDLVKAFNDGDLQEEVYKATYMNIQILLESDKILHSSSERTLLRNLGKWLGMLTIQQYKPILRRRLDIKKLVLESFDRECLIVTIPFVAKILVACAQNRVFEPPNPWLMGVLSLLAEIYQQGEIKLTLQFEIEKLLGEIGIKLDEIRPTDLLRKRKEENEKKKLEAKQAAETDEIMNSIHHRFKDLPNYVTLDPSIRNLAPEMTTEKIAELVDRSIRPIIALVVERSVYVACITTKEIVLKDFASETNVEILEKAAHNMVLSLTSSLALVTCKEYFRAALTQNLKTLCSRMKIQHVNLVVDKITSDNIMLGCRLIGKAAMDRAIDRIDTILAESYKARRVCQRAGKLFFDHRYTHPKANRWSIPEALLPQSSGITELQLHVYNQLAKTRQGLSMEPDDPSKAQIETDGLPVTDQNVISICKVYNSAVEVAFQIPNPEFAAVMDLDQSHPFIVEINRISQQLVSVLNTSNHRALARTLAEFIFVRMHEHMRMRLLMELDLIVLGMLRHHSPDVTIEMVTRCIVDRVRKNRPNVEVVIALVRETFVSLPIVDSCIAQAMKPEHTANVPMIEMAVVLLRAVLFDTQTRCDPVNFPEMIEELRRIGEEQRMLTRKTGRRLRSDSIAANILFLLDRIREHENQKPGGVKPTGAKPDIWLEDDIEDDTPPPWAYNIKYSSHPGECLQIFEQWLENPTTEMMIRWLEHKQLIQSEDAMKAYFRTIISYLVKAPEQGKTASKGKGISGLSRLVRNVSQVQIAYLKCFLYAFQSVVLNEYVTDPDNFHQAEFYAIISEVLVNFFRSNDNTFEPQLDRILSLFAKCFHECRPQRCPPFVFAWAQLICHRHFMPKLLEREPVAPNQRGKQVREPLETFRRRMFHKLLLSLFHFLSPFLQTACLNDGIRLLYQGTLRILLVLLHDFPEFLCEFHFDFCNIIPATCVQLRNLILAAFPVSMRLPDPFLPNLKVDLLPEIHIAPRIFSDIHAPFRENPMFDQLLKGFIHSNTDRNAGHIFYQELQQHLLLKPTDPKYSLCRVNIPLINAIVLQIGRSIIDDMRLHGNGQFTEDWMQVFVNMMQVLDPECRYHMLNAIANQLRYPNTHTHFFSCVTLVLFADVNDSNVQEQITRVLLERLIVHRPHPWGLLITFIELIKNPRYSFWEHGFTRCAPEIQKLFESVARSCTTGSTSSKPNDVSKS